MAVTTAAVVSTGASVAGAVSGKKKADAAADAAEAQEKAINDQRKIASEQWDFYKEFYQPLEKRVIGEAQAGFDPAFFAARAGADVSQMFDRGRESLQRQYSRLGIDPSAGRFTEALKDMQIAQAAAEAGARTQARAGLIKENFQRRFDVLGLGRGIPTTSAAALASAGAGLGGVAAAHGAQAGQMFQAALQAPQTIGQYGKAIQGAGNVFGDIFGGGTPAPATTAPAAGALGTLSGTPSFGEGIGEGFGISGGGIGGGGIPSDFGTGGLSLGGIGG
jgi:hypothetical protein